MAVVYPFGGFLFPISLALTLTSILKRLAWRNGKSSAIRFSALAATFGISWFLGLIIFFNIIRSNECKADIVAYGECLPRTGPESAFDFLFFVPGCLIFATATFLAAYFFWLKKPSGSLSFGKKICFFLPSLFAAIGLYFWMGDH